MDFLKRQMKMRQILKHQKKEQEILYFLASSRSKPGRQVVRGVGRIFVETWKISKFSKNLLAKMDFLKRQIKIR
jgi:hypothetical protein